MKRLKFFRGAFCAVVGLFVVIVFIAAPVDAQEKYPIPPQLDGAVKKVNIKVDLTGPEEMAGPATPIWWEKEFTHIGADYLRVHFDDFKHVSGDFQIQISDRSGNVAETIDRRAMEGKTGYWSKAVKGSYALVILLAAKRPKLRFQITGIAYQRLGGVTLSITEPDNREPIADYLKDPVIQIAQRPVARILFISDMKPHVCTGFLVSDNLFVTNHHCVPDKTTCDTTVAMFGYQKDKNDVLQYGKQYSCVGVLGANYEYDYSLLKLEGAPGQVWGRLEFSDSGVTDGQALTIIQHPAGEPKQVSKIGCSVSKAVANGRAPDSDFSHLCDTLGGSSGSPVINQEGKVVGLHHYGFDEGIFWNKNRAVRGSFVKKAINDL